MNEPLRPRVGFQLEVQETEEGPPLVDGRGHLPWFPFPGGSDWMKAIDDACRKTLGVEPQSVNFADLADEQNQPGSPHPWIGARFRVRIASGSTPRPPWQWR